MLRPVLVLAVLTAFSARPVPAQTAAAVRIGIISGDLGSFAATILKNNQKTWESIKATLPADSLGRYDLIVVDNLYRLQDLNAAAFQRYVERGGVLVILNPKVDGFSKSWSPYDVFIGEYAVEGRIKEKKHPLFEGFTSDKLQDFATSNGPFVGNCSFTEPAREWTVLARHAKRGKNALILEAAYGTGHILLACTRFDHYNAKPGPTRLGDNLFRYAIGLAAAR